MTEDTQSRKIFLALRYLWRRKTAIVLGTFVVTLAGLVYALVAPKIFVSRAIIYPQDISAGSEKSALGGFTGALNPLVGVSHLNRVEIVLNSPDLARQVILKNRLIPVLLSPDWASRSEQEQYSVVNVNNGISILRRMVSTKADVYKMTLEIRTAAPNPALAYKITQAFLDALNERTKASVIRAANENREFLEGQMDRTMDPSSKEKIQDLIIQQMEKAMLLNANAFEVLEAPEQPTLRESPRRKRIVMASVVIGFLVSCFGVLAARGWRNLNADTRAYPD